MFIDIKDEAERKLRCDIYSVSRLDDSSRAALSLSDGCFWYDLQNQALLTAQLICASRE